MSKSTFAYVTFIRTTPEQVWTALTTPEFMRKYWFDMHCESDWKTGSSWKLVFPDGRLADVGKIVEADPPRRLVIKWRNQWKPELEAEGDSLCTFTLEVVPDNATPVVKLSIVHSVDRRRIEADRGCLRRLAAHPVQSQVPAGNRSGHSEERGS